MEVKMIKCTFLIGTLLLKAVKPPAPQEYWGITKNNYGYYAYVDFKNGSYVEIFDEYGHGNTFEAECVLEAKK
jgi:hypothetical protein